MKQHDTIKSASPQPDTQRHQLRCVRGKFPKGVLMRWNYPLMLLLTMLACLHTPPALAQRQTEVDGTRIEDRVYRSYESNWRKYARFACEIDGGYAYFPSYDRRFDNSLNMTTSQAMDKLTKTWEEKQGNLVQKRSKSPPREDAEALAKALPELKIGSYGYVASAEVVEIINDKQMIVRQLWLVNLNTLRKAYEADEKESARRNNGEVNREELNFNYQSRIKLKELQEERDEGFTQSFRLIGYDTRGLRVGDRWEGPNNEGFQVGVARWETPQPAEGETRRSRREEPRLVLSAIEPVMRTTLDEEGFKKLLKERGMTVVDFVNLMRDMRENDPQNAEQRVINSLLPPELKRED